MITRSTDSGFTLVELMVVVLIIGILVALAIPVFNSASASSRTKACYANMRTIEGAVEQWLSSNPDHVRLDCDGAGWVSVLVPGFVRTEPLCPTTGAQYTYDAANAEAVCNSVPPHPHW